MFDQAQTMLGIHARTATSPKRAHRSRHPYIFKSLVHCGACHRKMEGMHAHGIAYYRCRYPREYALANTINHPRTVIMREDKLIRPLDTWLVQELNPAQRQRTIAKLIEQAKTGIPAPSTSTPPGPSMAECDAKLARYRAALDAGADPAVVATWIAETQLEREQALRRQTNQAPPESTTTIPTAEQITAIVEDLGNLVTAIRDAEPEHKLEVYRSLGLHLTYEAETRTVRAQIDLGPHRWDSVGVRGATRTDTQPGYRLAGTILLPD
ncbi:zinc ribbon domain-containing protein [Asanoa sp. WMMD1127]|uniref:zinc ribbon domain-containing protein n=1 Tax=Asanoa sp. WMMD1127 TaxID=3016107 RepID=UPI00241629AB|nr:zinc ribbon domain-containing protein [Asanoa sp. WMMD1127]MDG4825001.1 zinc ribbon domain-containing protein [Asanoa sp. WMMD1127]